jgi:hypothetical protein
MRQMILLPKNAPVSQFHCTDCKWVFHVQQPISDVPLDLQQMYAERWFAAHSCSRTAENNTKAASREIQSTRELPTQPSSAA